MKKTWIMFFLLIASASWGAAGEQPSVGRGKELYASKQLGASGKCCADCHPNGRRLEKAAGYKEDELTGSINRCVKNSLKGKPLAASSIDMKSLIMYMRVFGPPTRP